MLQPARPSLHYILDRALQDSARQEGRVFVAPYDDPYTIAGQGTIGTEILRQLTTAQLESLHAVLVPVGGGGLIAGIAAYVKALKPGVKVIGVEPSGDRPYHLLFDIQCMAYSARTVHLSYQCCLPACQLLPMSRS